MAKQKKSKRPTKKIVLFIVEGCSEIRALEGPIQTILSSGKQEIQATFLLASCDVTSESKYTPENIEQKINLHYFKPFFSANEFCYPKDILEVVHICDLDGTFIPDENCLPYDANHVADKGFIYASSNIYAANPENIRERNHKKAANIRHLLTLETIKVISKTRPYSLYFFSSNLDHYLYDKPNLPDYEKRPYAEKFAKACADEPGYFTKRMCQHSQALKNMTLEESWAYIMEGCNSVKRYTNFNLYIENLKTRLSEAPTEDN